MLSGDTLLRTNEGWKPVIKILAGGKQITDANKYTFKLARGTSEATWEVISGRPHKWPTKGITDFTYDLRKGDVVPAYTEDAGYDPQGWLHGFLKRQGHTSGNFRLPSHLQKYKNRLKEFYKDCWSYEPGKWDMQFRDYPFTKWPYELEKAYAVDAKYHSAFISGYLDGGKDTEQIQVGNEAAAKWLFDHAPYAGYVGSGVISKKRIPTQNSRLNATEFHDVFCFQMVHGRDHAGFRVDKIEPLDAVTLCWWRSETKAVCIAGGISAFL